MRNKHRKNDPTKTSYRNFIALAEYCARSESRTLLSYFALLIRRSRPVLLWERYVKYVRRFRALTTALRLLPWILLLISTHTLLYAAVAVAAILIPLLLAALISLAASATVRYREVNRIMEQHLSGKTVFVLFPPRNHSFDRSTFWRSNLLSLAARESTCAVVVSPFFLSPRGLRDAPFYWNAREEAPRVFLVRRHYFYALKKNVLQKRVTRLFFIY